MSIKSVVERLEKSGKLEEWTTDFGASTEKLRPEPDIVAFFVAYCREMKQLSLEALASLSDVSVSSIERIERGETISVKILDNVAIGLGLERGYFTEPRKRLGSEKSYELLSESLKPFENNFWIPVEHFSKQRHARELSRCEAFLIDTESLYEDVSDTNGNDF